MPFSATEIQPKQQTDDKVEGKTNQELKLASVVGTVRQLIQISKHADLVFTGLAEDIHRTSQSLEKLRVRVNNFDAKVKDIFDNPDGYSTKPLNDDENIVNEYDVSSFLFKRLPPSDTLVMTLSTIQQPPRLHGIFEETQHSNLNITYTDPERPFQQWNEYIKEDIKHNYDKHYRLKLIQQDRRQRSRREREEFMTEVRRVENVHVTNNTEFNVGDVYNRHSATLGSNLTNLRSTNYEHMNLGSPVFMHGNTMARDRQNSYSELVARQSKRYTNNFSNRISIRNEPLKEGDEMEERLQELRQRALSRANRSHDIDSENGGNITSSKNNYMYSTKDAIIDESAEYDGNEDLLGDIGEGGSYSSRGDGGENTMQNSFKGSSNADFDDDDTHAYKMTRELHNTSPSHSNFETAIESPYKRSETSNVEENSDEDNDDDDDDTSVNENHTNGSDRKDSDAYRTTYKDDHYASPLLKGSNDLGDSIAYQNQKDTASIDVEQHDKEYLEQVKKEQEEATETRRLQELQQKEQKEEENRRQKESEELLKREQEEQARQDEEARILREAEEQAQREIAAQLEKEEKARRDEEERIRCEAEEQARVVEEERLRKEAEERAQLDEEERVRHEAEEKARIEEEERMRKEAEEQARRDEEERIRREAEEKARREEEERLRKEAEERARIEEEERLRREAEEQARREEEERLRHEAEEKARIEEEESMRKEAEEQARRDEEERIRRDAEEKEREDEEERQRLLAFKQSLKQKVSNAPTSVPAICPYCEKNVYPAERLEAINQIWHKSCFVCGGRSIEGGCKKVLTLQIYVNHGNDPFCKACHGKNFGPKGFHAGISATGITTTTTTLTPAASSKDAMSSIESSKHTLSTTTTTTTSNAIPASRFMLAAPRCPLCDKNVYPAEKLEAINQIWHKSCFTCGGTSTEGGCKKVLSLHNYTSHGNDPFCKTCYAKYFGAKGFHAGISTTGISTSNTVTPSKETDTMSERSYMSPMVDQMNSMSVDDSIIGESTADISIVSEYNEDNIYKMESVSSIGPQEKETHVTVISSLQLEDPPITARTTETAASPRVPPPSSPPPPPPARKNSIGSSPNVPPPPLPRTEQLTETVSSKVTTSPPPTQVIESTPSKVTPPPTQVIESPTSKTPPPTKPPVPSISPVTPQEETTQPKLKSRNPLVSKLLNMQSNSPRAGSTPSVSPRADISPRSDISPRVVLDTTGSTLSVPSTDNILPRQRVDSMPVLKSVTTDSYMNPTHNNVVAAATASTTTTTTSNAIPASRFMLAAPRCPLCDKNVYPAEKLEAINQIWHKSCFTCGGTSTEGGCKKVLSLHNYTSHGNDPFCKACYAKYFGAKGFHAGISTTGISTSNTVTPSKETDTISEHSYVSPIVDQTNSMSVDDSIIGESTADISIVSEYNEDDIYKMESVSSIGPQEKETHVTVIASLRLEDPPITARTTETAASPRVPPPSSPPARKNSIGSSPKVPPPPSPRTEQLTETVSSKVTTSPPPPPPTQVIESPSSKILPLPPLTPDSESPSSKTPPPTKPPVPSISPVTPQEETTQPKLKSRNPLVSKLLNMQSNSPRAGSTPSVSPRADISPRSDISPRVIPDTTGSTLSVPSTDNISPRQRVDSMPVLKSVTTDSYMYPTHNVVAATASTDSTDGLSTRIFRTKSDTTSTTTTTSTKSATITTVKPVIRFGSAAVKCAYCDKSVYPVEKIEAIDQTWHKICFLCGGKSTEGGCKRVLTLHTYVNHGNNPFCKPCYTKHFGA